MRGCALCAGYNVCIFAYGQTGSGKTHTMAGTDVEDYAGRGINYRALDDLFALNEARAGEARSAPLPPCTHACMLLLCAQRGALRRGKSAPLPACMHACRHVCNLLSSALSKARRCEARAPLPHSGTGETACMLVRWCHPVLCC
jgi:hypothetical protein